MSKNLDKSLLKDLIDLYASTSDSFNEQSKKKHFEAVISTMNDDIVSGNVDNESKHLFKKYISQLLKESPSLKYTKNHWISIANEDKFPVGVILKKLD